MALVVPEPREIIDLEMDDGAVIRVRRHGNPDGARMFIANGNGFAADGYVAFWGPLAARFDLVVFDMRNHGWNGSSAADNHNYAQMARDVECVHRQITERLGAGTSIGIFHSMSARAAMKHAIEIGWRWDALFLFDPPNVPPPGHREYERMDIFEHRLADWAMGRPDRFHDPSELARQYADTRAHANWVENTHDIMARAVLHRDEAGGDWVLTCAPALEARIYLAAMTLDLWPDCKAFAGPVKLIGADPEIRGAPGPAFANRALAEDFGYDYEAMAGAGHLLQIQKPAECRDIVFSFLEQHGVEV